MVEQEVAEQVARGRASAALTVHVHGWTPSKFFDEWTDRVDKVKGRLVLQFMHHCRGMTPDVKKRAVDYILRGTMPVAYRSADHQEALDAMDNDIDAMREYADHFVETFWKEYWADFLARHPHNVD